MPTAVLAPSEIAQIADACASIANEVADETGFVPMRDLLSRFHARLLIRPLLVEGMLASVPKRPGDSPDKMPWAVLVDQDTYPISLQDVAAETRGRSLPARLRNTIAHELAHSLAFRPSEFGVKLRAKIDTEKALAALVQEIERQTERLSPLLLWPEKAIASMLENKKETLTVSDLIHAQEGMGVSRYVLVTRLCLLQPTDPNRFLFNNGLRNLAIGIAEWGPGRLAAVKGWPLFRNFVGNVAPAFIYRVIGKERVWANELFGDDDFIMCGGNQTSVELVTGAGTASSPNVGQMKIQVAVEDRNRQPGREFLFAVRGQILESKTIEPHAG